MSTPLAAWPDVELALLDLLTPLAANNGTETPPDFTGLLPFLRVNRFGGTDDRVTDTASVSVDVFAATRRDAQPLAEQVRQLLLAGPHIVDGYVLDHVSTVSAPAEAPWENTSVRRWSATYRVSARRPTTTS